MTELNLKHELKGLAIVTLYASYTIMLFLMICSIQADWRVIVNFNRWNEGIFEAIWFILMTPGLYYLWTENLSKKAVKRSDEIQELLDSLRWQPEEKEEAEE